MMNNPFQLLKYHLKKVAYWTWLRLEFYTAKEFFLIFQMGKVGSSSLEFSLKNKANKLIYKIHFLSDEGIAMCEDSHRRRIKNGIYEVDYALLQMKFLHQKIAESRTGKSKRKWKVICIVREPIIRTISAYFQNAYRWIPDFETLAQKPEDVLDMLIKDFQSKDVLHKQVQDWFDQEVKPVFGIDVLNEGFNRKTGYSIYERNWCKFLVLKLEKMNENIDTIRNFTGAYDLELANFNESDNKYYADVYKNFKNQIALPENFVNEMYNSRYSSTFYSNEEIKRFVEKWTSEKQVVHH